MIDIDFKRDNASILVQGSILDHHFAFLIDTGASYTIIHKKVLDKIPRLQQMFSKTVPTSTLKAVNGTPLQIGGQVEVPFKLSGKVYPFKASVLDGITYDVILGKYFFAKYDAIINFRDSVIQLKENEPEPQITKQAQFKVHVDKTLTLPARSETIISARIDGIVNNLTGLVEPKQTLHNKYSICGAVTLVTVHDNFVPVRLLNPTSMPIKLCRNTHVGTFTVLDESVISAIDTKHDTPLAKETEHKDIHIDLSKTDLTEAQKLKFQKHTNELNDDIFAQSNFELGRTHLLTHDIKTDVATPFCSRRHSRVSDKRRKERDKHILRHSRQF